jgi:hypothetical protein
MPNERTPSERRDSVRSGIRASLERDAELRAGRLLVAAGVAGVLGALGAALLSGHPFGHHPPWHVPVVSAVWAGLLVVTFALVFLGVPRRAEGRPRGHPAREGGKPSCPEHLARPRPVRPPLQPPRSRRRARRPPPPRLRCVPAHVPSTGGAKCRGGASPCRFACSSPSPLRSYTAEAPERSSFGADLRRCRHKPLTPRTSISLGSA